MNPRENDHDLFGPDSGRDMEKDLESMRNRLERLEELHAIFRIWIRFREKIFPSRCSGRSIRGIDLVLLDANLAGCVSKFLLKEQLGQEDLEVLYLCNDSLDFVVAELQFGVEAWYFRQLKLMTAAIVEFEHRWRAAYCDDRA